MPQKKVRCEIISPERILYQADVDMVVATTVEGEIGILPLHIPLVTQLKIGELRLKKGEEWLHIAVHGGFLKVVEDRVTVLADGAEFAAEIDMERAKKAAERAQEMLAHRDEEEIDVEQAQLAYERAALRLKVTEKKKL